jgi:hypothetical protein
VSFLALPTRLLGPLGRPAAAAALACGVLLLALAPLAAVATSAAAARFASCGATGTCPSGSAPTLQPLLSPLLALAGALLAGAGLACLLRRRGQLDRDGQRLLDEAKAHFAAGTLPTEAFQATRDRLHAKAESREGPQLALGLGAAAPLLGLAGLAFAAQASLLFAGLRGAPALTLARSGLLLTALAAGALLLLGALVLLEAGACARRVRGEAAQLRAMLRDLEFDILDEVRRSPRRRAEAAVPSLAMAEAPPLRPAP